MSMSLLRGFSENALQGPAGKAEVERADEGAEVWRASLLSSVSAVGNPTGELLGALWLLLGAIIGNPSRVLLGARMSMSLLRGFSENA
jgi:hypothetical protein